MNDINEQVERRTIYNMNYINEQVNRYNNIQYELYKWTRK